MISHDHQRLLPGEKELADKLRPLVEPLRKQFDTKEEQAVCLQEIGELYLKAGVELKNGKDFTKAAALFNAALVRTSKEEVQNKIKGHLVVVRQEFMKAFYPDAECILQEQWEEIRMQNIHTLEKIRTNIKDNSRCLKLFIDRYDINAENLGKMETCLVNAAEKVTLLVQEKMLELISILWNQSMEFTNGKPPCKYSIMGLGSLARQEVTPYSDLEFAILIGKDNVNVQRYFENLTCLFHLSVLDLGETPLPQIAIPSLNDFVTPGGDWFYDKITPSGFKLDGEMPWACKIATGRQATRYNIGLSLIKTPAKMAELLKDDSVLGQSYHVADVLSRTIHIIGNLALYNLYLKDIVRIVLFSDPNTRTRNRFLSILSDVEAFNTQLKPYTNAKCEFYRYPSISVEHLRLWLTPLFPGGSQWSTIENFVKMQVCSEVDAFQMKVIIALAYGVRLFTYLTHRGQRENIGRDQLIGDPNKSIRIKIKEHLSPILLRIWLPNSPENVSIELLEDLRRIDNNSHSRDLNDKGNADPATQILEHAKDLHYDYPRVNPSLLNCYYGQYFFIALKDRGLVDYYCSITCLQNKIYKLDCKKPNIENFDFLLENTHLCTCVSMVKNYIRVHKYCTQRILKLPTGPPDVNLNCIFQELLVCTELRDKLFLNFNLLKQAYYCTDVTTLKSVVKSVEIFLGKVVPYWPEKEVHKRTFHFMEFEFYQWLKHIYEILGKDEKLTTLLERWIHKLEIYYPGGDIDTGYIGIYTELGKVLLRNPEKQDEAIRLYKIALHKLENKVSTSSSMDKYVRILSRGVISFAKILAFKKRFAESEELIKEYFFNANKSFHFKNEQIIKALLVLGVCYRFSERWMECTEVCEKIYHMVKDGDIGEYLSAAYKTEIGKFLILMYCNLGKIVDLPKPVEFHRLACNIQEGKELAVLEHKIFLLTSSLFLFSAGFEFVGNYYVTQALALDPTTQTKKLDFSRTDMWLHILVVLCDALNSFSSSADMEVLFENHHAIVFHLRQLSKFNGTSLDLYQIYVDYRFCHFLFRIAMDPDKTFVLKSKETTDYLNQTQTRLIQFFPKCTSAIKWCKDARLCLNPNTEDITRQDYLEPRSLYCTVRVEAYKNRFHHIYW